MGIIESILWVVVLGALVWLAAALTWQRLRAPALELGAALLIAALGKIRWLLKGFSLGGGGPTLGSGGGVSLDVLAAALIEHLKAARDQVPAVGPAQGLISWNLPKTLPTALWRDVQVRISRGSMRTADHRAGLKGGPPAFTRTITVGTRMAVRLHTTDPALQIDDLQADARERDLPDREPRHWDFRIRSDAKGWRELSLVATPLKPALDDQFLARQPIRLTHTRFGAWYGSLPSGIRGAGWTAVCGLAGLIGFSDIAKPYVQEPVRALVERIFGPPPAASPPATVEKGSDRAAGD